jgi:hypothetical protein
MDNGTLLKFYFSLIVLEFIALFFGLNMLHIITNVLAAPLVLFLYLRIIKFNYKWYFIAIFFFLYATDIFHLLVKPDLNNLFCIYLNTIAYLILTFFVFKTLEFKKLKDLDYILYISFVIVLSLFLYIFWVVNDILIDRNVRNYPVFVIYAFLVIVMSVLITMKYIIKPNKCNTSLLIVIPCFIISDVFYLMNIIYKDIYVFKYLFLLPQLLVYFFLLKFELNRNKIFDFI